MKPLYYFLTTLFLFFISFAYSQNQSENGDPVTTQESGLFHATTQTSFRGDPIVLEAGDAIEGDYFAQMAFSTDGELVFVPHRVTDNISVMDWDDQTIIQNIEVGDLPIDMAVTDDYAIVACYLSNEVYIIDLSDYSTAAIIPTANQPAKVKVSGDGQLAVVGCDEPDIGEVIDLNTLTKIATLNDFPVYQDRFSFITSNPRFYIHYSGFAIDPTNTYVINGGGNDNTLRFWEIATEEVAFDIPEITNCSQVELSGDGTKLITVKAGSDSEVSQVDLMTYDFVKVSFPSGTNINSTYSSASVNMDGSKAFVSVGASDVKAAIVRFDTEDFTPIPITSSPNWVGHSADRQYAIAGQFYFTIVDFESESVVSQSTGRPISNGAVSPEFNRMVATDPLRYETLYFYDFENPEQLTYLNTLATGSELEADVPYSVTFNQDGTKALIGNSLSGTLSLIDVENEVLEAIIPIGSAETYHPAFSNDGNYALIAKRLEDEVDIIDLNTYEIVATVGSGGDKPDQLFMLPDQDIAYVMNAGGSDRIGVIELDGANSTLQSVFQAGNFGISWTNYGIRPDLKIVESIDRALVAAPFDDQVNFIDIVSHEVLSTTDIPGFPLQIALSDDTEFGIFAGVTLKNSNEIALLTVSENGAGLIGTYACFGNPTRIAYDPITERFAVCSNDENTIQYYNIEELEFEQTEYYGADLTPISVAFSETGDQYTLLRSSEETTPHQFWINEEVYELPNLPIHNMAVLEDGSVAAVCMPGSDQLALIKAGQAVKTIDLGAIQQHLWAVSPNPATTQMVFTREQPVQDQQVMINIYNVEGKLTRSIPNASEVEVVLRQQLSAGTYFYQIWEDKALVDWGKVVLE